MSQRSNLFEQFINAFPDQVRIGLKTARSPFRSPAKPSSIIIAGMGGSALPGLLLESLASRVWRFKIPIVVHRDYGLPNRTLSTQHSPPLVICVSYSGNTEETLSAYREAKKRRWPVMAIASGGTLAARARRDRIPFALIPKGLPPRFAIGSQLGALVGLLASNRILLAEAARDLGHASANLKPQALQPKAKTIAHFLKNRIPVVYASAENSALAYIWKIQMNENVKIPAFTHVFPELNHNELQSYARLTTKQSALHKTLAVVVLEDSGDTPPIKKRMRIMQTLIKKRNVPCEKITLPGNTLLTRSLNSLLLAEWTALALAQSYGIDPIPVALIENFKKRLRK